MVCGFRSIPEGNSISVAAENIAPFSIPQEVLNFEPPAEAVVARFANGEEERKIHCNIELQPDEQERLQVLRELAWARGRPLFPCLAAAATRYLSRNRGDARKSLKEMLATQDWREAYFRAGPLDDAALAADLAHGIAYLAGRDCFLRPALVIRPARVPPAWYRDKRAAERIVRLLVFCMEYLLRYMVAPGRAEGGVVLLDLGGLSLSQVPMSALTNICTVMSNHYVNRVFRFYVLNVPPAINRVAGMGLRLLTERQRQKLQFVKDSGELRREFALHQLERDLGGERPVLTTFFPFPLQAGPFDAGYAGGPDPSAVPHVHTAIAQAGMQGNIWNPELSVVENTRLEFTEHAEEIFLKCGLQPPDTWRPEELAAPKRLPMLLSPPSRAAAPGQKPPAPDGGPVSMHSDSFKNSGAGEGMDALEPTETTGTSSTAERVTFRSAMGEAIDGEDDHSQDIHSQVLIQESEVALRAWFFCMPSCQSVPTRHWP